MHAVAVSAYMDTMYAMEDTHWDDDQLGLAWNAAPIMGLLCMERGRGTAPENNQIARTAMLTQPPFGK